MTFKDLSFTWKNIIISAGIVILLLILALIQMKIYYLEGLFQIIVIVYLPVIIPTVIIARKFEMVQGWFDLTPGGFVILAIFGFIYTLLIVSLIHWIILKTKKGKK